MLDAKINAFRPGGVFPSGHLTAHARVVLDDSTS